MERRFLASNDSFVASEGQKESTKEKIKSGCVSAPTAISRAFLFFFSWRLGGSMD